MKSFLMMGWNADSIRSPNSRIQAVKAYRQITLCTLAEAATFLEQKEFRGKVFIDSTMSSLELSKCISALSWHGVSVSLHSVAGAEGSLDAGLYDLTIKAITEGSYDVAEQLLGILNKRTTRV